MKCNGCGNETAHHVRIKYDVKTNARTEYCDSCSKLGIHGIPDVAVPNGGYYDEHLGCQITSKQQKAALLKEKGWVECGDRINPTLGKRMPDTSKWSTEKRRKFFKENFGG